MMDRENIDAERALLAAEYALGLLEGADRAQASELYRTDQAFAAEVDRMVEEGAGWVDELPTAEPGDGIYARVAAAVGLEDASQGSPASNAVPASAPPQVANDNGPGLWRPAALAASLAAFVFAGLWLFQDPQRAIEIAANEEPQSLPYEPGNLSIAQISSNDATSLVTALYDNDTGTLYLRLSDIPDPDRVPELWLLDSTGTPRSLGFATRNANSEIILSQEQRQIAREGGTLAISLEQPAATPHAMPSDVLGAAQLASLDAPLQPGVN